MGTIFKKQYAKPIPADAKIVDGVARWKANGKTQTAKVNEKNRIVLYAATWTAKYRDGSGKVRETSTGCKDQIAAKQVLADLEKRADGVRSGIRTVNEDSVIDHLNTAFSAHLTAYINHQKRKGLNSVRIDNNESRLTRLSAECGFNTQTSPATSSKLG